MKFEYDDKEEEKEFVAFIDYAGDLCIAYEGGAIYFLQDDQIIIDPSCSFECYAEDNGIHRKLYPGDKITITF